MVPNGIGETSLFSLLHADINLIETGLCVYEVSQCCRVLFEISHSHSHGERRTWAILWHRKVALEITSLEVRKIQNLALPLDNCTILEKPFYLLETIIPHLQTTLINIFSVVISHEVIYLRRPGT